MPVKQNIPLIAFLAIAAAAIALAALLTPPEEDQQRQAVNDYLAALGPVKHSQIHGDVVDVLTQDGKVIHAQFEKVDGRWTFARDLAAEFEKAMKDPAVNGSVLQRLGERLAARFNTEVKFTEGHKFEYQLAREADGLTGVVRVGFSFGRSSGQYFERFHWKDGAWKSDGPGTLLDRVGK